VDIHLGNLFGLTVIAFAVPFMLGFLPRVRVPSVVVELLAGILFGPALLGWIEPDPVVSTMSALGVAFLLFLAGLDLDLRLVRGAPLKLGTVGFLVSLVIAVLITRPLGANGTILSPLLISITLCATSVGIVMPVLRDTGQLGSPVGQFAVAGGSVAEIGTIALLGVFFAGPEADASVGTLLFAVVAVAALLLLITLRRALRWRPGRRVFNRLDDTSAQMRVRFAMMMLMGAALLAASFEFEAILGTFLAGIVFGIAIRGDRFEERLRTKLEGIGFGFFVPAFFVTSGLRFYPDRLDLPDDFMRILLFLAILLTARALPALLYLRHLSWREALATGLLQATNLPFIVVAVAVGTELGRLHEMNATALIVAGLISAVLFPALAQWLLGTAERGRGETSAGGNLDDRF
jgi:Kef-type K+ transport system membrane component KefB